MGPHPGGHVRFPSTPPDLPWPNDWTRELGNGWPKFVGLALAAAAFAAVGIAFIYMGDLQVGVVGLLFGVAGALVLPTYWPGLPTGSPHVGTVTALGVTESGLRFPYARLALRFAVLASVVFAAVGLALALVTDSWAYRVPGICALIVFSVFAAIALRRQMGTSWYAALTPDRVVFVQGTRVSCVWWQTVEAVVPVDLGAGPGGANNFVHVRAGPASVAYSHPPGRMLRMMRRIDARVGAGIFLPTRGLRTEPLVLVHALRFYYEQPSLRSELGSTAALARSRARDFPMTAPRT